MAATVPNDGLGMLACDHVVPEFEETKTPEETLLIKEAVTMRPFADVATEVQPMLPPGAEDRRNAPLVPVLS
jgi:hypothetical protein